MARRAAAAHSRDMIPGVCPGLARFAWGVLLYTVSVILWGAYVRATGSGAGCGSHWPLCNGEIFPRAAHAATLIEFSHRLTSGLALLAVIALAIWTWRATRPGHAARRAAVWSVVFMLTEAAVGAGLVLFELVAGNASIARALFMAVHLVNTFFLLAWVTLSAHWIDNGQPIRAWPQPGRAALFAAGAAGLLLVGASGAIAALGDTLYPAASLREALQADLSPASHALIRLRLLHPAIAIVTGLLIFAMAARLPANERVARGRLARRVLLLGIPTQLAAGFLNMLLLAPVWMQILHLLLTDMIWVGFVLFAATLLADSPERQVAARPVTV
jgi:heme a synthase